MLPVLVELYDRYAPYHNSNDALTSAIESICAYHAPLQQGNEVAWALWLAKKMNVQISRAVGDRITKMDDDIVALVALDLAQLGLLNASGFPKWRNHMTAANVYDAHWLIAYEALEQGWLPPRYGTAYVAADSFFSILSSHGVRFYGAELTSAGMFFDY
jgi:hypothetical protein